MHWWRRPIIRRGAARRARELTVGGLGVVLVLTVIATAALRSQVWLFSTTVPTPAPAPAAIAPFPLGVDPRAERIAEQPGVTAYLDTQLAEATARPPARLGFFDRLRRAVAESPALQQLASPSTRVLVIWAGDRREAITDSFGDILRWDDAKRGRFEAAVIARVPTLTEGTFAPGKYVVSKDADPESVAAMVADRFEAEVLARYPEALRSQVPLEDALTIASLLQREAYDFKDMRVISGVIWNRLFADMPLQLDATIQYVRGSQPHEPRWWPTVVPADKYLDSPFNTYQHVGLPPGPIANPSAAAVLAALNPRATDCYYYFHADDGTFYCSPTYEGHVALLKEVFGRGR